MKLTYKKIAIAEALAILVLAVVLWWQWQYASETPELPTDGNGDPLLLLPLHPARPGDIIKVVSASELIAEFRQDKDAASKKYSGRLWVNGTVTEISGPTVLLEGPQGVHFIYVSIKDQARLDMGRKVTIEGFLKGSKDPINVFRPWKRMGD